MKRATGSVKAKEWTLPFKEFLKRDLFVQGLIPLVAGESATLSIHIADTLLQACAAEEQDMLLGELHREHPPSVVQP